MAIDEFPTLGRLELFAKSLSLIAGYGIRACLAAQDLTQIYEAYGRNESITSSCRHQGRVDSQQYRDSRTAVEARRFGKRSACPSHLFSKRRQHIGVRSNRPSMTPEEVRRLGVGEILIFARGQRPVRAALLRYYEEPYFKRLTTIAAPSACDRTVAETPVTASPEDAKLRAGVCHFRDI